MLLTYEYLQSKSLPQKNCECFQKAFPQGIDASECILNIVRASPLTALFFSQYEIGEDDIITGPLTVNEDMACCGNVTVNGPLTVNALLVVSKNLIVKGDVNGTGKIFATNARIEGCLNCYKLVFGKSLEYDSINSTIVVDGKAICENMLKINDELASSRFLFSP